MLFRSDLLLYPAPDMLLDADEIRDYERVVREAWQVPATIHVERRRVEERPASAASVYGNGLIDFTRLHARFHPYYELSGAAQVAAVERCLERQPDWIFAHQLDAMCPLLLTRKPLPPIFFDLNDVEHKALATRIKVPPHWRLKPLLYLQVPSLWRGERRTVRLARRTFVCSESDRDYLVRSFGVGTARVLPNSTEVPIGRLPDASSAPTIGFIGTFWYTPNVDAGNLLMESIWPRVKQAMPNARLLIAGGGPEHLDAFRKSPADVRFSGFVPDIADFYRQVDVVCCPIQAGGGTRIKIIEAAAYGRPVVSTVFGASGLEFENERSILLRDDPAAMAAACVQLLTDGALRQRLAGAARTIVEHHYDRRAVRDAVRRQIQEGLDAAC